LPNAITAAKKMEEKGLRISGVRIDSGDLAFLARECRTRLDSEGLDYIRISASNNLDEFIIKSLIDQKAPIDSFGVGTKLVTGNPDGALDGVYKLASSGGKPRIKLTENIGKMTFPHKKQVLRILDNYGSFSGADAIVMYEEKDVDIIHHPLLPLKSMHVGKNMKEELLHTVMENGIRISQSRPLADIARGSRERLGKLPSEFKRFDNPHTYKVSLSSKLLGERNRLVEESRKKYESTGNS
jgi:nicotinate phosphoribosyltransferase